MAQFKLEIAIIILQKVLDMMCAFIKEKIKIFND